MIKFAHNCRLILFILSVEVMYSPAQGGNCWTTMNRNGRCTELLSEKMTKEACCKEYYNIATAWSEEDMDSGTLFFWRVLGGGVPCYACKETCNGVHCGEGKKCVVRNGRPKCVCSADCKNKGRRVKGPVCGTDGRSYRNICRLKKRACRRKSSTLQIAYHGLCQSSCDSIQCPTGKYCLLDQNLNPHCVKCSRICPPKVPGTSRPVCGSDGLTYPSTCHLREAACRKGKAIPVAYKGRCKNEASCGNITCKEKQSCLTDLSNGNPRCVTCNARCPKSSSPLKREMGGPICGTNNRTYHSWCHMIKDSCETGYVIETKHSGTCRSPGVPSTVKNTVLDVIDTDLS